MFSTTHLHPMMVHFPIALVALGFFADLCSLYFKKEVCLSKCGLYLLLTGTLAALLAILTGVLFTAQMQGSAGLMKEIHETFAWLTLVTLIITSIVRIMSQRKGEESIRLKWFAFALYGLAVIFVSLTGFFGGNLVYNYMMPL